MFRIQSGRPSQFPCQGVNTDLTPSTLLTATGAFAVKCANVRSGPLTLGRVDTLGLRAALVRTAKGFRPLPFREPFPRRRAILKRLDDLARSAIGSAGLG